MKKYMIGLGVFFLFYSVSLGMLDNKSIITLQELPIYPEQNFNTKIDALIKPLNDYELNKQVVSGNRLFYTLFDKNGDPIRAFGQVEDIGMLPTVLSVWYIVRNQMCLYDIVKKTLSCFYMQFDDVKNILPLAWLPDSKLLIIKNNEDNKTYMYNVNNHTYQIIEVDNVASAYFIHNNTRAILRLSNGTLKLLKLEENK